MNKDYEKEAKLIVKKLMLENELTFKDLVLMLNKAGYDITATALQQKINRGKFEFSLYLRIKDLFN